MNIIKIMRKKQSILFLTVLSLFFVMMTELAFGAGITIGSAASNVTQSMAQIAKLITAGSYVAGFGFAVGAILKFKAHKDNPTQIPVGTPIALIFIAAALIFLPSIFGMAEKTIFGQAANKGTVSGVTTFS